MCRKLPFGLDERIGLFSAIENYFWEPDHPGMSRRLALWFSGPRPGRMNGPVE
jgi:hypothetical protein